MYEAGVLKIKKYVDIILQYLPTIFSYSEPEGL